MMVDWQPVETAPRDGSTFLTWSPGDVEDSIDTAGWSEEDGEFWKNCCGWQFVTHWAPMPNGPAERSST